MRCKTDLDSNFPTIASTDTIGGSADQYPQNLFDFSPYITPNHIQPHAPPGVYSQAPSGVYSADLYHDGGTLSWPTPSFSECAHNDGHGFGWSEYGHHLATSMSLPLAQELLYEAPTTPVLQTTGHLTDFLISSGNGGNGELLVDPPLVADGNHG